jgi:uncharacterized protein (DUF58 family)
MNWDLRHRKSSLVIRLLLAAWITVVVVVLCATGRWWGLLFVVPLVLDLRLLRRILAAGPAGSAASATFSVEHRSKRHARLASVAVYPEKTLRTGGTQQCPER